MRASAAAHRRTPGARARNPARDRRAGRAHAPGDPCRHVRRGMRLHRRRPRPPRGDDAPGCGRVARATFPSSTRGSRTTRSSCSTDTTSGSPSTRTRASSSRSCAGATGSRSPRSTSSYAVWPRARARDPAAGRAPRFDLHCHERRQARRPLRDAVDQPPRGSDPRGSPDRPAPGRPRRRDRRRGRSGTYRSPSIIASSTGARAGAFCVDVIGRIQRPSVH